MLNLILTFAAKYKVVIFSMLRYCFSALVLSFASAIPVYSQNSGEDVDRTPLIHGTLRGKYEFQTGEGQGRFEVRNARLSVSGKLTSVVEYKAEVDLCDEGKMKMLDAYARFKPFTGFNFTIGQMRVPFTIDAHRSPHAQYFANRSFIAKQVGNVRDVGCIFGYKFNVGFPVVIEAGLFNGSGLTEQKDYWTNSINYSVKAQLIMPRGFNITLSTQKIKPDNVVASLYDIGAYYHGHGWHVEAEYLLKHYSDGAFENVSAFNTFVNYDIALRRCFFQKISPLLRYDYTGDHSNGKRYLDGSLSEEGHLVINDYRRSRITGGVTLSMAEPFISDIRINYEKYFYRSGAMPKTSEKDKIVVEFITRF